MTETQLMGLKIILIFLIPISVMYWTRSMLTSKTPQKPKQLLFPRLRNLYRLRPATLRFCTFHLTSLPEGRIALVVEKKDCGVCQKEKYNVQKG